MPPVCIPHELGDTSNGISRRPPRASAYPRRTAFTFLELVVVVLIMGILAAAAAPTFYRSLVYHRLESAARRVKLDLEQLRHTARVKSQSQTMEFTNETTYSLSAGVRGLDHPGEPYVVDLAAPPFDLDSVTIELDEDATVVAFDGYGIPSLGGTIVLEAGGQQRVLTLDGETGQIE